MSIISYDKSSLYYHAPSCTMHFHIKTYKREVRVNVSMGGWITRFSAKASKPVCIAAAQPPPICLKLPNWYHHQPEPHQLSLKDLHRNAMQLFSDVGVYLYPRPQTSLLYLVPPGDTHYQPNPTHSTL